MTESVRLVQIAGYMQQPRLGFFLRPPEVLPGLHQPSGITNLCLPCQHINQSVSLRNDIIYLIYLFFACMPNTPRCVTTGLVASCNSGAHGPQFAFWKEKGPLRCVPLPPFRCIVRWRACSQDDVMHRKSVCLSCVQMKRLLQLLQQRWLLRSLVLELRTAPTSFAARPCFPREQPLPPLPPLHAPARAPWRWDWCTSLCHVSDLWCKAALC